jgi:hypothetical protein
MSSLLRDIQCHSKLAIIIDCITVLPVCSWASECRFGDVQIIVVGWRRCTPHERRRTTRNIAATRLNADRSTTFSIPWKMTSWGEFSKTVSPHVMRKGHYTPLVDGTSPPASYRLTYDAAAAWELSRLSSTPSTVYGTRETNRMIL